MQGLQILSGKYKGGKVYTQSTLSYRPTKSRVRKSLFDHLGDLGQKSMADLFSGTGIMGLEAASRGAKRVVLVENDGNAIRSLEKNLARLIIPEVRIYRKDVFLFLKEGYKFDLIFADPPYEWYRDINERIQSLLDTARNCLNENGLFILEAPSVTGLDGTYSKVYGDTKLIFWRKS